MINENVLKGQWKVIKGEARKLWGKLTDDELDETRGNISQMEGLLQRKMGFKQEEARTELHSFLSRFTGEGKNEMPKSESRSFQDVKMEEDTGIERNPDKTY